MKKMRRRRGHGRDFGAQRAIAAVTAALTGFALLSSCASPSAEPVVQGFDLLNDGQANVTEVEIRYGDYVFPAGGESATVRVPRFKGIGFHQGAEVPIPESATVHWKASDGRVFDVKVPIRRFVADRGAFRGFQFVFEDDHVELRAVYARPDQRYGLARVPVYSSAEGDLR